MQMEELRKQVLDLPDSDRATLAGVLLDSLPYYEYPEDEDGVAGAERRSKELDEDPSMGCSWEEIKRSLGR